MKHILHGMSHTRVYKIYHGMLKRCNNPKAHYYSGYGGRGIKVCKRWHIFEAFYKDMGEPPTKKHSIDRIDGDKGYSPNNCRWATPGQQLRNSSRAKHIKYRGRTQCITDWATEFGIDPELMMERLRRGFTFEEAVSWNSAHRRDSKWMTVKGEKIRVADAARKFGVKYTTLLERLRAGWDDNKAALMITESRRRNAAA